MIKFFQQLTGNVSIKKQLKILIIAFLVISIMISFLSYEMGQVSFMQDKERDHAEYTQLISKKLLQIQIAEMNEQPIEHFFLQKSTNIEEMGLMQLYEEINKQPIEVLSNITGFEQWMFGLLGYGEAFVMCKDDIVANKEVVQATQAYLQGKLSKEELNEATEVALAIFSDHNVRFIALVLSATALMKNMLFYFNVISLMLVGIFIFVTSSNVNNGLQIIKKYVDTISNGDFTKHTNTEGINEFYVVINDLDNFKSRVNEVLTKIKESSSSIFNASTNMRQSSESMSGQASELAVLIEEIGASIQEMTSAIEMNKKGTVETREITKMASDEIFQSNEYVKETKVQMEKITQNTKVINEITRQTNLLALNAAVEASRVGEEGKGFAVVAGEIRKLAEMSAKATVQIEMVTEKSVEVANQSVEKLASIIPTIEQTSSLIENISQSSIEQSSSSNQINESVQSLNNIAQKAATNSEKLSANAEELKSLSSYLTQSLNFFKL